MPETEEGRSILHRLSGMADTPTLETSKRLLNKTPFENQSKYYNDYGKERSN
jgi:hypothetical protein